MLAGCTRLLWSLLCKQGHTLQPSGMLTGTTATQHIVARMPGCSQRRAMFSRPLLEGYSPWLAIRSISSTPSASAKNPSGAACCNACARCCNCCTDSTPGGAVGEAALAGGAVDAGGTRRRDSSITRRSSCNKQGIFCNSLSEQIYMPGLLCWEAGCFAPIPQTFKVQYRRY